MWWDQVADPKLTPVAAFHTYEETLKYMEKWLNCESA
jgi:hypothetical protein